MTDPHEVVVADDHPLIRKGLVELLNHGGALRVVGEAADGEEALWQIETHGPAVALLDLEMPKLGGLEVAARVRERGLATVIIILTVHRSGAMLERALQNGVRGYLLKDHAAASILECIHLVLEGGTYISPGITEAAMPAPVAAQTAAARAVARLSPTELRVLKRVALGETTREVAEALGTRSKTVERHRSNICAKLGITGQNVLLRFAAEHRALLG